MCWSEGRATNLHTNILLNLVIFQYLFMFSLLLHFSGVRGLTSSAQVKTVNRWISTVVLQPMGQVNDTAVSRIFLPTHSIMRLLPMKSCHLTKSVTLRRSSGRSKTSYICKWICFFFCLSTFISWSFCVAQVWFLLAFFHALFHFFWMNWISSSFLKYVSYVIDINMCTVCDQCKC